MKIRFDHPCSVRLDLLPGDEVTLRVVPPALEAMLIGTRMDGTKVARVVDAIDGGEEVADATGDTETAVTGSRRRHAQRPAPVSG
jgi:hypothetical protein